MSRICRECRKGTLQIEGLNDYEDGMINRWADESGRRGPSTYWDWSTTAHRTASQMGITLVNPMGEDDSGREAIMLNFSDGVSVDTSGKLRIIELVDGLYVTGEGFLIPVTNRQEGEETIQDMTRGKEK